MYLQLHDTDTNLSRSRKIVNTMMTRYICLNDEFATVSKLVMLCYPAKS